MKEALEEMGKEDSDPLDVRIEKYRSDGNECFKMSKKAGDRTVLLRTALKAYTV